MVFEITLKFEEQNIESEGQSHDYGAGVKWTSVTEIVNMVPIIFF